MGFSDRLLDPLLKRGMGVAADLLDKHFVKAVEKREASGDSDDEIERRVLAIVTITAFVFFVFYGLVRLSPCSAKDRSAYLIRFNTLFAMSSPPSP